MRIIKYFRFLIFLGIVNGLIYLLSCSEGTNPNDKKFVLPDSNVSFNDDIYPLFYTRCSSESGCHSPTDYDNPLYYSDLLSRNGLVYHQLSNYPAQLVELESDPLNPESSKLYLILYEGFPDEYDDQMPPPWEREPLNKNQLNGIKKWIEEGALDN